MLYAMPKGNQDTHDQGFVSLIQEKEKKVEVDERMKYQIGGKTQSSGYWTTTGKKGLTFQGGEISRYGDGDGSG